LAGVFLSLFNLVGFLIICDLVLICIPKDHMIKVWRPSLWHYWEVVELLEGGGLQKEVKLLGNVPLKGIQAPAIMYYIATGPTSRAR
jgi:hypothetical protein